MTNNEWQKTDSEERMGNSQLSRFLGRGLQAAAWIAVLSLPMGCRDLGTYGGGFGGTLQKSHGVPWTILVLQMEGPYAADNADRMAQALKQIDGISAGKVRVTHDADGFSRIYYGVYTARRDRASGTLVFPDQLTQDIRKIKYIRFEDGANYFALARRVRMPIPDVGNPAWSLRRVDKPYTLQIAVFEADEMADYKTEAAKLCRVLREKGYEAYYYHASSTSMVTVGAFDRSAVRVVGGKVSYSPEIQKLRNNELFRYNLTNGKRLTVHKGSVKAPVLSQLMLVPGHEPIQQQAFTPSTKSPSTKSPSTKSTRKSP